MICTYMVCTCMYSVHKHSSFPIRPNQPCYAGQSLLCTQSVPVEQHPGATSRQGVGICMYVPCIYHVQTAHIHFQAVLSYAMIQTCIYMAYTFTVLYIHCNNMYIHVYTMYRQLIYIFKHSCRMLGDRNLPFCTYWAHARCLGCPGVCQFVYTGHIQQYSLLILSIYNFDIL